MVYYLAEQAFRALKRGTQFTAWGSRWTFVRSERGRRGEARTMYVIRRSSDGHQETRARATVLAAASEVSR